MRIKSAFAALLGTMILTSVAFAQEKASFEGSLSIDRVVYNVDTGQAEGVNQLRLDVNPTRLRFTSDGTITISRSLASIQTSTIFLRHDQDDILFLTAPTEAVQLTRASLVQFMSLINQFSSFLPGSAEASEVVWTREQKELFGLACTKVIVRRTDRNEETHVWITDELNINWGLVNDIPAELGMNFSGLLDAAWLSSGSFPISAVTYLDGKMRAKADVTEIFHNDPISRNIDIGPRVKTVALSDYIINSIWRR